MVREATVAAQQTAPAGRTAVQSIAQVLLFLTLPEGVWAIQVCKMWYRALNVGASAQWIARIPCTALQAVGKTWMSRHFTEIIVSETSKDGQSKHPIRPWHLLQLRAFANLSRVQITMADSVAFVRECQSRPIIPGVSTTLPGLRRLTLVLPTYGRVSPRSLSSVLPILAPPELTHLFLDSDSQILSVDFDGLERYQALVELNIGDVSAFYVIPFWDNITALSKLETLHLPKIQPMSAIRMQQMMAQLGKLPALRHLIMRSHSTIGVDLAPELVKLPMLSVVDNATWLSGSWPFLHRMPRITTLVIRIDYGAWAKLLACNLSHITHLTIAHSNCAATAVVFQRLLNKMPHLVSLNLDHCIPPDLTRLHHPTLQIFKVTGSWQNPFTDPRVKNIIQPHHFPQLRD
jgi:hypothetical protein